jgi:hypothetical protein
MRRLQLEVVFFQKLFSYALEGTMATMHLPKKTLVSRLHALTGGWRGNSGLETATIRNGCLNTPPLCAHL